MTPREFLMNRRIGWLAVIAPLLALTSIWISIMLSPWFTWQNNAVSDLGVHSVAPLFNTSLILCGSICAIFTVGLMLRFKSLVGKLGSIILFMACISLVGIGIFNEDWRPHHFYFSVAFFVLLLISAMVLGPLFLLKRKTRFLGLAALAVIIIGLYGWAYYVAVGWGSGIAIPEALTFVPGALWISLIGLWVLRKDAGRMEP